MCIPGSYDGSLVYPAEAPQVTESAVALPPDEYDGIDPGSVDSSQVPATDVHMRGMEEVLFWTPSCFSGRLNTSTDKSGSEIYTLSPPPTAPTSPRSEQDLIGKGEIVGGPRSGP